MSAMRGDTAGISREKVEEALKRFRGSILQTPPLYSALKHQGRPLYKLARSGIEIERKSRQVQIYSLEISNWQPPLVILDIICGKGTYIRSLAHDLGEELGCGAHMKNLVRLKVGPFCIEDAFTLDQLKDSFSQGCGPELLYPIDYVLTSFNAVVVNHEQQCSLIHGAPIVLEDLPEVSPGNLARVYTDEGSFLGMAKYDAESKQWQPEKIFLRHCGE
jgi:tRNA pseudouridine55 synthase